MNHYECKVCNSWHSDPVTVFKCPHRGQSSYYQSEVTKESTEGKKFDTDKVRLDLIPSEVLLELGKVLTYGAGKYDSNNWRKGIHHARLFAACLRHLFAYKLGQSVDPESGLSHLSHALCNIVFLVWMVVHRPDLDDLVEK